MLLSESSVGAGVRRIEAVTSGAAWAVLDERARELAGAPRGARRASEGAEGDAAATGARRVPEPEVRAEGGVNVIVQPVDGLDADELLELSDRYKQKHAPAAVVLGSREDGKVHLVANFDASVAERVSASDVLREAAAIVGGGGGGRPTMARAGGKDPEKLPGRARRGRAAHRRRAVKVLALDYGAARTGVAVSDATGTIARPLGVVERAATDGRPRRDRERSSASTSAERVVVGMPLTLRGERGQQAVETEAFVEALRAARRRPGRDVRRAVHDGARRARRRRRRRGRARRGASARELPASSVGRDESPPRCRRARVARARRSPAAWATRRLRRAGRDDAAARAAADHLPGGVHAPGDGRPGRRGARDRDRQARRHAAADEDRLPAGERGGRAAGRVPEGLEAELDRGLSLPRDVRVHEAHVVGEARPRPAAGVPPATGARSTCATRVEEPHAVRRPDHRVDDREGDGRAGGAPARRGGDLQPAAEPDAARDRRDDPVRPQRPRHRAAQAVGHRERQPVQHAQAPRAAADADLEPRSRVDARRRQSRAGRLPLLRAQAATSIRHFFTASESEFCQKSLEYGFGGC